MRARCCSTGCRCRAAASARGGLATCRKSARSRGTFRWNRWPRSGGCRTATGARRKSPRRWRQSISPRSPTARSRRSRVASARALLARVLAGEPEWILADEPLAALDLAHQLALLAHVRQAAEAGAGVVLVLHDLALAMNHADRVLV